MTVGGLAGYLRSIVGLLSGDFRVIVGRLSRSTPKSQRSIPLCLMDRRLGSPLSPKINRIFGDPNKGPAANAGVTDELY